MSEHPANGHDTFMTVREMVIEIRDHLKDLDLKIDRLEQNGSHGTKQELADHETRIRSLEVWKYGIPVTGVIAILTAALFH